MSTRPVDSRDFVFTSPCYVWKRLGFRCVSCKRRYSRVRVKAAKR